jgi:hypothetical protein
MREEFLLDALVDDRIEPEGPTRTVPHPKRRALAKQIRAARADLAKLEGEYRAAAADNTERRRPTIRGLKAAHAKLGKSSAPPAITWRNSSSSAPTGKRRLVTAHTRNGHHPALFPPAHFEPKSELGDLISVLCI